MPVSRPGGASSTTSSAMKAIAASRSLLVHARWWAKAICNAGLVMISPSGVTRYDTDDPRNGTAVTEVTFEDLVAEHRRELLVHCYRLLGSVTDAEDVLQEALLAAWRGLDGFEGRARHCGPGCTGPPPP